MRRTAALAVLIALSLAAPAGAGIVQIWSETGLHFTDNVAGGFRATQTSTGLATLHTSSGAPSHLSTLTLPSLSLVASVPLTDPSVAPMTSAIIDQRWRPDLQGGGVIGNVSGAVGGAGALTPNTIPVTGSVTLCLLLAPLPPCVGQLEIALGGTKAGARIGAGVGGILTIAGSGSIQMSLVGAPFTVNTVTAVGRTGEGGFDTLTARGFAHGPASLSSSTAETSGVLQLVTVSRVPVIGPGDGDRQGFISRVLVRVVPEPGLLLLLGSGAALVAWLGWRQQR